MAKRSNGKAPAKPRRGLLRRLVRLLPAFLVVSLVVWVGLFVAYAPELPDTDALFNDARQARVTLIAADGTVLAERGASGTAFVQLGEVSLVLRDAVIATGGPAISQPFGLDVRGTLRALVSNLRAGGVVAGGSTLDPAAGEEPLPHAARPPAAAQDPGADPRVLARRRG
ncbi:MAG: transglycosylase domain-containing protein [Geminicoccaceae bacterium]